MQVHITGTVIIENFATLSDFKHGEKPVTDTETGQITKDDRALLVGIRRYFHGFEPQYVRATFNTGLQIIQNSASSNGDRLAPDSDGAKIYAVFLKAIAGVRTIAGTYRDEKNGETAKKLEAIADEFFDRFGQLPELERVRGAAAPMRRRAVHRQRSGGGFQQAGQDVVMRIEPEKEEERVKPTVPKLCFDFDVEEESSEDGPASASCCGCFKLKSRKK